MIVFVASDEHALGDIFQFSDVTRILIEHEPAFGLHDNRGTVLPRAGMLGEKMIGKQGDVLLAFGQGRHVDS